jgi:hypothetical protein
MKLVIEKKNVERNFDAEISKFSIETSSKAFKILSDNIYSNKIEAIVREISTNASDAHKDCGKDDLPFDINLPSEISPFFSVRDYGNGLSHEDCTTLYTTYFKSTKTDENISTGCLGLGSKSPFCYTDSFNIESIYDGVKRTYIAAMETDGPTLTLLHEELTEEPSGLKVMVPVKRYDFRAFSSAATKIYKYFDIKPNCDGISFEGAEYLIKRNDWGIEINSYENKVIMGQVAYSISIDNDIINKNHLLNEEQKKVACYILSIIEDHPVTLFVEIGELDFSPSREELSYNPQTVRNICLALLKVNEDIEDCLNEEITIQPSMFAARKLAIKFPYRSAINIYQLEWNCEKIFPIQSFQHKVEIKHHADKFFTVSKYKTAEPFFKNSSENPVKLMNFDHYFFLIDNDGKLEKKRARIFTYRGSSQVNNRGKTIVFFTGTESQLREALEACDTDEIPCQFSSTINFSRSQYSRSYKTINKTWVFKDDKFVNNSEYDRKDKTKNYIYIEESRGSIFVNSVKKELNEVSYFINDLGKKDEEILNNNTFITLKPSEIKKVKDLNNFTSFESFILEFLKNNEGAVLNYTTQKYTLLNYIRLMKILSDNCNDENIDKELEEIIDINNKIEKFLSDFNVSQRSFFTVFSKFLIDFKNPIDYQEKIDIIKERFSLLCESEDREKMNRYVKDMCELEVLRQRFGLNKFTEGCVENV